MREIKFRAWDKENEAFLSWRGWKDLVYIDELGALRAIYPIELQQYTGIKDKEGMEVYEGDIVYIGLDEPPLVVKYENDKGRFIFEDTHYDMEWKIDDLHLDDLVVIGNIHENPEILNNI